MNDFEVLETKEFDFETEEQLEQSEKMLFEKEDISTVGLPEIKLPIKSTPKINTKIVYSYDGPEDSANRPFCAEMLALNRYYTKDDMKLINAEIRSNDEYNSAFGDLEINVWKHRGGWYRKEGTDVSIPHCRHRWNQHLVITK